LEEAALFNSALEMVGQLPETPARDKQELDLLLELGPALMSIKGFAAAECEAVYRRANDLCRQIGETPRLYTVLWGQWMSRSVQARWNEAMDLATKLESIANAASDPEFILEAHHVFWNTCFFRGELAKSQFHMKEGLTLYDPERHQLLFSRFGGHDPGVCANCHGALNLWLLGKPDRSVGMIHAALHLAQRLNHHHDIVRARVDASWLWQLRREPTVATQHAKVAAELSSEYALPFWQARANIMIGWSLGEQGHPLEGIPLMRQALAQYKGTGAKQQYSYSLLLLAETLLKQGQVDESMEVLADAETMLKNNGERFYEPELYRTQAEALLRKGPSGNEFAEQKLRVAVSTSRQLGFKSWELRAATSLARLLRDTGRRDEGRATLAEIYNWFTEGFDTADLKDAKALLNELGT
jgi:adenylate cyclase